MCGAISRDRPALRSGGAWPRMKGPAWLILFWTPMKGSRWKARVTVEGRGKLRSATTDSHGRYEISGLVPGSYVVRAAKDGYAGEGEFKVQVNGRGCAIQNLGLFARNSVKGLVIDPGSYYLVLSPQGDR